MKYRGVSALIVGLCIVTAGCSKVEPAANTSAETATQETAAAETAAEETAAEVTATDVTAAAETVVADESTSAAGVFDIEKHAFSFENYGNENGVVNLSSAELVRMFGDSVCGGGTGPNCRLLPTARAWMERTNNAMAGGHCEGLATLALLMEEGVVNPVDFGASNAAGLKIEGNTDLQREIAYWWATQDVAPTFGSQFVDKPSEIVSELQRWFANPKGILGYTVGFYKPDRTDGHAVTPIGISDNGDGLFDIVIYDNNYPGEKRFIKVDTNAETWTYNGATIPTDAEGKYEGDAETLTLDLTPTETRLTVQECPFCGNEGAESSGSDSTKASKRVMQVFFDDASFEAGVRLSITNVGGAPLPGVVEDHVVGADLWKDDAPPSFRVPINTPFQINIDATNSVAESATTVTIIGNGFTAGVDDMTVEAGETTVIEVDPITQSVAYVTERSETPDMFLGVDGDPDSYYLTLGGLDLGERGGRVEARLDRTAKTLTAKVSGTEATSTVALRLERINDDATESLDNDGLELTPDESLVVGYGAWKGNSDAVDVGVDTNGDGSVDESIELQDES